MSKQKKRQRWSATVILAALLLVCTLPAHAEKSDVIILKNGDKLTGEIRKLDRGKLKFSTDDMETIQIQWNSIEKIKSKNRFEVEIDTGKKFIGSLQEVPGKGKMRVAGDKEKNTLEMASVVRISPFEQRTLSRIKGSLSVGFTFARANRVTQWSLGADLTIRTPKRQIGLKAESFFSDQENVESTTRNSLGFQYLKFFRTKWSYILMSQMQENEELGLNLRLLIGGGAGHNLIRNNRTIFSLLVGMVGTRETFSDSESSEFNLEALGGMEFSTFKYQGFDTDITVSLVIYPSLTPAGRVRIEFNGGFKFEIFKDVFLGFNVFDHYDSKPPVESAEKNDYGVMTSIGWSFK